MSKKKKAALRREKARARADEINARNQAIREQRTKTTKDDLAKAEAAYQRTRRRHYGLRKFTPNESVDKYL